MKYLITYLDKTCATYENFEDMPVEEAHQFLLMEDAGTTNWTTGIGTFTIR